MTLQDSILSTLAYHDIFEFPLTKEEIHKYLIQSKASINQIDEILSKLIKANKIGEKGKLFFLKKRERITTTRLNRKRYSNKKYKKALFFAKILRMIPTLNLIAISGALSMENSHINDDIDLVLMTTPKTLWTTRFLANVFLLPFKREPGQEHKANRACLNIFIDSSDLQIGNRNLYTVHEICQMKLIWDRNQTYSRFIKVNSWIKKFLPNWQQDIPFSHPRESGNPEAKKALVVSPPRFVGEAGRLALSLENLLKNFQLWYMRSKISTERIGDTQLFFHPQNTQDWVLKEYQKRLRRFKI